MNNIIDFVLRLFGRVRSIESVTANANKIVHDLEAISAHHKAKREKAEAQAAAAKAKAQAHRDEAEDAAQIALNWKSHGLVRQPRKAA